MEKKLNYSLNTAGPMIDTMKPIYYVQSSETAALIGRNPYTPVEQAILRFMKRKNYSKFKDIVKQINVNEVTIVTDKMLKENVAIQTLFYKAIKAKENDLLQDYFKLIYTAIEETNYYKTMKEFIQEEVKSRINKARGTRFENKGINQYEKKAQKRVTDRNSEMFEKIVKREEDYTIVLRAKIDGIDRDNNCLIEHKNRVNELFKEIPIYEKVQLEIYMHITQLGSCKLVQTHFEDTNELSFQHSKKGWKEIKKSLIQVIRRVHELMNKPDEMKRFMSKYRKYL
mgnify:CR=1 FL=1